jgi:hypothetical protein
MIMRSASAVAAVLLAGLLLSCGSNTDSRQYSYNDLQLITSYTAKEMCSCLFVMEQSEAYCRVWTKQSPAVASVRIDAAHKTVESYAVLFWGARARWVDEKFGCVLE